TETPLPADAAVCSVLRAERGTKRVPYPAFSSKAVDGTPLFAHALAGTLDTIEIPTHEETIYRISLLGCESLSGSALSERIGSILMHAPRTDDPKKRSGKDFRQDAIRAAWQQ